MSGMGKKIHHLICSKSDKNSKKQIKCSEKNKNKNKKLYNRRTNWAQSMVHCVTVKK